MSKSRTKRTKGQGSVFTDHRSPYWQISYWDGKRQVRKSSFTTDRGHAVQILQSKLNELIAKNADETSIAGLLQLVIQDQQRHDRSAVHQTERRIEKLLSPVFGHIRSGDFTTTMLNEYIRRRKYLGRENSTINRELALLRRAFRLGHEHDPQLVRRIPVIKPLREDNVREGFLDADKYQLILDALSEDIKPIFVVAYHLGMRTGELLALKRSWVDLSEGLIFVNGRVTKNNSAKTVPIYGEMKPWLEKTLADGEQNSPRCPWLFSNDGKPVKSFKSDWTQARESAGVPELLFHDLRRTAVRNMIRAGVSEKVAMKISGHKTPSMLWRYNITDTRDIKDAGERIETYLNQQRRKPTPENIRPPAAAVSRNWCPGRDLNPHSACAKKDFKSFSSCRLLAQDSVSY